MKRILKIAAACVAIASMTLFTSGCSESVQIEADNMSAMRLVAGNAWANIYVVDIDGKEYIVALGAYKAAICPK